MNLSYIIVYKDLVMNKLVLVVSFLMIVGASYAQVYKWTDAQGNVHFSDTPHEGAEQLKIPETQTYSPPASQLPSPPQTEDKLDDKKHTYTTVNITQPDNEGTIRNNQGYVAVALQLEPELFPGDMVQMIFDGAPLGAPQPNLKFQLNGINRGSHTITVEVIDSNGDVVNTSNTVTFFMHRPRVGMAAGGKGGN